MPQIFQSSWKTNARPMLSQKDTGLDRVGKQFIQPYYYPAFYLPEQNYPRHGVEYVSGFSMQQPKNGFQTLPSESKSLYESESINQSSGRSKSKPNNKYNNKHNIGYSDEEAMKLAESLVNGYLTKNKGEKDSSYSVIENLFRDFNSTDSLWKTGNNKRIIFSLENYIYFKFKKKT